MRALARVTAVEHLGGRTLRVCFSDGLIRELDFAGNLFGVLAAIDDDDVFAGVSLDRVAGTIRWAAGIEIDPDVLHGDHAATPTLQPRLVRAYCVERQR